MKNLAVFCMTLLALMMYSEYSFTQQSITVKAGDRIIDYFPPDMRFRYPDFIQGQVYFRNKTNTASLFNYNYLSGKMEFILNRDTMEIIEPEKIKFIVLNEDTFYYQKGYLEIIYSNSFGKLALKSYYKVIDRKKQAAYGTTSSTSAISSYNSIAEVSGYYKLQVNDDIVLRMQNEFYLYTPANGFFPFWRKKILQSFPQHEDKIKLYCKQHKIDFKKESDLIDVLEFLRQL